MSIVGFPPTLGHWQFAQSSYLFGVGGEYFNAKSLTRWQGRNSVMTLAASTTRWTRQTNFIQLFFYLKAEACLWLLIEVEGYGAFDFDRHA